MTRAAFTAADIKRAVKAVRASGALVMGVDFPAEGGFRVLIGEPVSPPMPVQRGSNEWDAVLTPQ